MGVCVRAPCVCWGAGVMCVFNVCDVCMCLLGGGAGMTCVCEGGSLV